MNLGAFQRKKPDDYLLSHKETLHYHWRESVSLLSSRWDQVVPNCYCHQANWYVILFTTNLCYSRTMEPFLRLHDQASRVISTS